MLSANINKYRGIFISTTLFILFFIGYLVVNFVIQKSAFDNVDYAYTVHDVNAKFSIEAQSTFLKRDITSLQNGGVISLLDGRKVTVKPLSEHLEPVSVNLDAVSYALNQGDVARGRQLFGVITDVVDEKKLRTTKLLSTLQIVAAVLTALLYFVVIQQLIARLSQSDVVEENSKRETEGIMETISEGLFLLDNNYDIGAEQSRSLKDMFKSDKDLEGNFLDFISRYVTQKNVGLAKEYLELLFGNRVKERLIEELNPLKQVEVNIVRRDGSYENHYLDFKFSRVMVDDEPNHLLCTVNDITKQVLLERELNETKEAQEAQLDMLKSILHLDNNKLSLFFATSEKLLHGINDTFEQHSRGFSDEEVRTILDQVSSDIHRIKGDAAALGLHKFEFTAHDLEDTIITIKKENPSITGKEMLPLTAGLRQMFGDLDSMKEMVTKFANYTQTQAAVNLSPQVQSPKTQTPEVQPPQVRSVPDQPTQSAQQEKAEPAAAEQTANEEIAATATQVDPTAQPHADHSSQDALEKERSEYDTVVTGVGKLEPSGSDLVDTLNNLAELVSKRCNKKAIVDTSNLNTEHLPHDLFETVQSIATQLVRNSIVHGVEPSDKRIAMQKPEVATIKVELKNYGDSACILSVRDDGKGIDKGEIVTKAIERGYVTAEKAKDLTPNQILSFLFMPGFSRLTEAEVGLDAGRGMGLDVVKQLVKSCGGKINLYYKTDEFCQFKMMLKHRAQA